MIKRGLIFCILIQLLLIPSCDLEEDIIDEVSSEEVIKHSEFVDELAAPAYAFLSTSKDNIFQLNQIPSDELAIPSRPPDWEDQGMHRQLHQHTWNETNGWIVYGWNYLDQGVGVCNTGLFHVKQMEQNEDTQAYTAELRFLRAYYRFWQYDFFRQIPLRDEFDLNYATPPIVVSGEDAFEWLEQELIEIIPELKGRNETPYGRITKGAAQMLLAKLYLNAETYIGKSRWSESLELCNSIIQSGEYSLNPDYWNNFGVENANNSEAMFVIRRDRGAELNYFVAEWVQSLHYAFPLTFTWNGPSVVSDFVYKWDADGDHTNGIASNDVRFKDERIKPSTGANLGLLIGPQFNPDGSPMMDGQLSTGSNFVQLDYTIEFEMTALQHEGVRVIKYEPDLASTQVGYFDNNDFMIFRYADLWLMSAEAKHRLGSTAEALADINSLRQIRSAPAYTSLESQDILDERRFELYWEGWRRQDQIRFGTFNDAWANKEESEAFRKVFPIPQHALAANPNLKQNPGY